MTRALQDKRFDHSNNAIAGAMGALTDMVNDRTGSRVCAMVGVIFVTLVVAYLLFFK